MCCQPLAIEPVHYGPSSILLVHFLGHPVDSSSNNVYYAVQSINILLRRVLSAKNANFAATCSASLRWNLLLITIMMVMVMNVMMMIIKKMVILKMKTMINGDHHHNMHIMQVLCVIHSRSISMNFNVSTSDHFQTFSIRSLLLVGFPQNYSRFIGSTWRSYS